MDEAEVAFSLWPRNLPAWQFFQDLADCWVLPPLGGKPIRIDRGEMLATMDLQAIAPADRPMLFRQMKAMQDACIEVWKQGG